MRQKQVLECGKFQILLTQVALSTLSQVTVIRIFDNKGKSAQLCYRQSSEISAILVGSLSKRAKH